MSLSEDSTPSQPHEAEIIFESDAEKAKGEVYEDASGGVFVKLASKHLAGRPELQQALSAGEELVTVWAKATDDASRQLIEKGQSLSAWVRVKRRDGKFVTKTALFSLGAVAAVTITQRAIRHYKPR